MNSKGQARNWSLTIYNIEPFDLILYIAKVERIKHYAFISHDKDVYSESDYNKYVGKNQQLPDWNIGDTKKLHIHLLLNLSSPCTLKWLESMIYRANGVEGTLIGEEVTNKYMVFRYLTHKDNPEKYQYDIKLIMSDNVAYWSDSSDQNEQDINDLINAIVCQVPLRKLARRYGKDFIKNYRAYIEFVETLYYQENNEIFHYFERTDNEK